MSVPVESGMITTILPEVCYPNVDATAGLVPSPVIEFLADEEAASTCPLLTPSPPAEFEHPLSITPTTGKMLSISTHTFKYYALNCSMCGKCIGSYPRFSNRGPWTTATELAGPLRKIII